MKTKSVLSICLTVASCFCVSAQVTTVFWDPGQRGTVEEPTGGAGTWNFTSAQWYDATNNNNVTWDNTGTFRAVFDGTNGGQVQIATGLIIEAESLVINKPDYRFTGGGVRRMTVHSGIIEANEDVTINVVITNPPSATTLAGIIKTGPARLIFGVNNNTFLGGLYVLQGSVVITNKFQIGGTDTPITINGGIGVFGLTDNVSARMLYIGDDGATVHLPEATDSWLFQMNTGTNGTLTKTGPGVFSLGYNYEGGTEVHVSQRTGATIIEEGTLGAYTTYGSALGTGPVTVRTNGILTGPGLIGGHVTVHGTISPIGSGALNELALPNMTLANGLDLSEGGTYRWELLAFNDDADGSPRADFDRITVTDGNLALGGASTLDIQFGGTAAAPDENEPFWQANHTWTILELSGTAANPGNSNFDSLLNASHPAGAFTTAVAPDGSVVLTFTSAVAPPQQPEIAGISVSDGTNAAFSWSSIDGRSYQVEYTTNLTTAEWIVLTNVTATGDTTAIVDDSATDPQRFYRVVLLP
jgi:autotransporter-associated beta strand protein